MLARQIALLVGEDVWLRQQVDKIFSSKLLSAVVFYQENYPLFEVEFSTLHVPFNKARNQLGQEHRCIIYDARVGINLEALAIAVGTLQAGGVLVLLFNHWESLRSQIDQDSLRWNGLNQASKTPNFIHFFQKLVEKYRFPIYQQSLSLNPNLNFKVTPNTINIKQSLSLQPTLEQREIIEQILNAKQQIYVITAKRGRGKSALAGFLASHLDSVIMTAPNKSAVKILQKFSNKNLKFIAPDLLCEQIEKNPLQYQTQWLIIDEAAMLPIPLLQKLISNFFRIVCTTTVQSYEGTGRGFLLRFMQKNHRTLACFELCKPLRWRQDDTIEPFIDELLQVNAEDKLTKQPFQIESKINISEFSQQDLLIKNAFCEFYGLLVAAHYRTSPVDLRRLFDAENQFFTLAECDQKVIGGVWTVAEGNMQDLNLIKQIQLGVRRPRGNLVAQQLCHQMNLSQACKLQSKRISRIALLPAWQQKGIGQKLIEKVVENSQVDFISVSFGYTPELAKFWQKCGFNIVHVGENQEATSGCYSVIALRAVSKCGENFCQKAISHFKRNISLSFHCLAKYFATTSIDWCLREEDLISLQNFANFHRSLSTTLPAIRRLLRYVEADNSLLSDYCDAMMIAEKSNFTLGRKQTLSLYRQEVKEMLQKYHSIL